MKTLMDLSQEIQKDLKNTSVLLDSFRTTSPETRDFLFSLKRVPPYIVPALLETFAIKHREGEPKFIGDMMSNDTHIGALFVICEDLTDWTYQGISVNGKPMGRPINSALIMELDPAKEIRYVF